MTGYLLAVAANQTSIEPAKGTAGLAWIVVLTIAAIGLLILIVSAFSQDNTKMSVDGDRSTYSQWVDQE